MTAAAPHVAFYCVTGFDFFPGAVALINSLRLLGHQEPVFVLDCGLDRRRRELLEREATVVTASEPSPPSTLKLELPLARPAQTMVLLDADIIVVRSLAALIERATRGHLLAFENDRQRFFSQWSRLLDLGPLERRPYATSSAVFLGGGIAERVLPVVAERLGRIDRRGTWVDEGEETNPLYYLDQDVLNAVATAELSVDEQINLPGELSVNPPFTGVRIEDEQTLRCRGRDGSRPFMLHHFAAKPWLVPMRRSVFTRLLTRLLLAPDVAVRLDPQDLPLWLRRGAAAEFERLSLDLRLAGAGLRRRLGRSEQKGRAWPHR